jgi:uncharacterized protein
MEQHTEEQSLQSSGGSPVNSSSYRTALQNYLQANANPQYKYSHQPRLYALTQQIGQGLHYDDDIVYAAAFLHDLGVFIGHRPADDATLKGWDHVAYAIAKAPAILIEAGFPAEKIPAVLEVIRTHQPQDTPATIEATIARDADILEQLGGIGVTRTLAKLGSDTRFHTFTDALNVLKKQLQTLPDRLQLESSKILAQPKLIIMQAFVNALEQEGGPHLH